jgi:NADPH-dependent curcumin reductase CurA
MLTSQPDLVDRLAVQGFICVDHVADIPKSFAELAGLYQPGKMQFNEDIEACGVEDYTRVVRKLYTGANTGKLMMKIAE